MLPTDYRPGRIAVVHWDSTSGPRKDTFVRGPRGSLVHWYAIAFGDHGVEDLGGQLRGDPVAVSRRPDRLDVFARGKGSQLLHWWWDSGAQRIHGPEEPHARWRVAYDPIAVSCDPARVDVYTQGVDNFLRTISTIEDGWFIENTGLQAAGPVFAEPSDGANEIFARGHNGNLQVTGRWKIGSATPRTTRELPGGVAGRPVARRWNSARVDVFAIDDARHINHWGWSGAEDGGMWFSDIPAHQLGGEFKGDLVILGDQVQMDLLAVTVDGELQNWHWDGSSGAFDIYNSWRLRASLGKVRSSISSDGGVAYAWGPKHQLLTWHNGDLSAQEMEWPDNSPVPDPVFIDMRPATHLVRRTEDMVVLGVDLEGLTPAGTNEVTGQGRVGLTFPPQHIGEDVHADGLSALSGPSRVAFDTSAATLNVSGLLEGLASGNVDGVVEIPVRLHSRVSGEAGHHVTVWRKDDVVALWRTRLSATQLSPFSCGVEEDGFELPLGFAMRALIVTQGGAAALERLELSALGGWLTVHGRWPSLDWDHTALLGRDWEVRTLVRGIIYPTGHRAVYTEYTTRDHDDPVAFLHKQRVLTITEPVRNASSDERLARVMPFDTIEATTVEFGDLGNPQWTYYDRTALPPFELESELASAREEYANLPPIPGDWTGSPPIAEDLADTGDQDQWMVANTILNLIERIDALSDQIEAVMETSIEQVPWFFTPGVRVPFRCMGDLGPVSFSLPVVFVNDAFLLQSYTMTEVDTLAGADIEAKLAQAFAQAGGGVVPVPGVAINLLRGNPPKDIDIQIVQQLSIAGVRDGRGFRTRLTSFDVDLVETRNLLPNKPEAHKATLAYSQSFEDIGNAAPIPLSINGSLNVDFRGATERSGGLIAPVIEATGLSATSGLVNAAGVQESDPLKMVSAEASLLGVKLHDLLSQVTTPPVITSRLGPDGVATVSMSWKASLSPSGPLQAADPAENPSLDLDVSTGKTICTLSKFALALPPKAALLKLSFTEVKFIQEAGQPAAVKIGEIDAEFFGALDLLKKLQELIDLGDAAPGLKITDREISARYSLPIPDLSVGAFVIRNASFGMGLTIPFRGDPVSVELGFASRECPFNLSVMMFGGGGYMAIEFRGGSLHRMEVSLEFGASVAVSFLIAKGEAHVMGGVRFELVGETVRLTGFLRIGGSLEILGLVSVSVELILELGYQTTGNKLTGRAKIVIEIDLTLWSDSVELDSGEWVIAGDDTVRAPVTALAGLRPQATEEQMERALAYRRAYQ